MFVETAEDGDLEEAGMEFPGGPAVEVIGRIQDPTDVKHLIERLDDSDPRVVNEAIFALGQMGSEEAATALVKKLEKAEIDRKMLVAEALGKISSNMNDRLEQMGKKMGISSAVEAKDVNFSTMFDVSDDEVDESNMGDVEVKKRTGGGIAGNLARLKKLKGND